MADIVKSLALFAGLLVAGLSAGCSSECELVRCEQNGGSSGGGNAGGGATRDVTTGLWSAEVTVGDEAAENRTMVVNGDTAYYSLANGRTVTVLFDDIRASDTGDALIYPPKGALLGNGTAIDSGDARILPSANGFEYSVEFNDTADHATVSRFNSQLSNTRAEPIQIAGDYFGTASDGTQYSFSVSRTTDFIGSDSNGCEYNLTNTFQDATNLYRSSGPFDPACDDGGTNFIDAAYWQPSFNQTVWFVSFRGENFALTMNRR